MNTPVEIQQVFENKEEKFNYFKHYTQNFDKIENFEFTNNPKSYLEVLFENEYKNFEFKKDIELYLSMILTKLNKIRESNKFEVVFRNKYLIYLENELVIYPVYSYEILEKVLIKNFKVTKHNHISEHQFNILKYIYIKE